MPNSLEYHLAKLRFLDFTEADRIALQSFQPVIEEHLDSILQRIDAQRLLIPSVKSIPGCEQSIASTKLIKAEHWLETFHGLFDLDYICGVNRMGLMFADLGLEPRWYVVECASLTSELTALCVGQAGRTEAQCEVVCKAMTKAIMLDLDYTLSVWLNLSRDSMARSFSELLSGFEKEVLPELDGIGWASDALLRSLNAIPCSSRLEHTQTSSPAMGSPHRTTRHPAKSVANLAVQLASLTQDNFEMPSSAEVQQSAQGPLAQCSQPYHQLTEASKKLEQVVNLMQQIADRTHLLATKQSDEWSEIVQQTDLHETTLSESLPSAKLVGGSESSVSTIASPEVVLNHAQELAQHANQLRMSVSAFIQSMRSKLGHT